MVTLQCAQKMVNLAVATNHAVLSEIKYYASVNLDIQVKDMYMTFQILYGL